ncbi:hypothetical protein IG631_18969 [Alternaria alternata]|nr:hypothetical protein IG631_18969 [Alternaria alternata]
MRGGGSGCLPAFFASHKMILKPGDRIWQPEAYEEEEEEEAQTSWAETPTIIRVHILNAENVRDWTGIDPPQSTIDPERYKSAGLSSAGDLQEFDRRAMENPDLYDQIEEYYHGKSTIMPLREHNPFRVILRKNAEDQSDETRGQSSKSKIRWWRRIFQKSKET